jgi:Fe-S-cluster containining protein
VSFHWSEPERALGGSTPPERTVRVTLHRTAMRGTEVPRPRCSSLEGKIGTAVSCAIYADRPSPCREFEASWANGARSERCDRARAAHGLPPLLEPAHARAVEPPDDSL